MPPSQINQIIVNLIRTATLLVILLDVMALVVFVWGIVKFIFASSNPEKLKDAKQILWWGIIGLFVLTSITGLVIALQTYFGVTGQSVPIPQFGPSTPAGPAMFTIPSFTTTPSSPATCNPPAIPPCFCDPRTGIYQCPE